VPELPDITVYLEALEWRVIGQVLEKIRRQNIFVLRTALPPIDSLHGRRVWSRCGGAGSGSRSASRAIGGSCCIS